MTTGFTTKVGCRCHGGLTIGPLECENQDRQQQNAEDKRQEERGGRPRLVGSDGQHCHTRGTIPPKEGRGFPDL